MAGKRRRFTAEFKARVVRAAPWPDASFCWGLQKGTLVFTVSNIGSIQPGAAAYRGRERTLAW